MTDLCVLHVDDEHDIRAVVDISLGLDPAISVRSCASGREAIAIACEWHPDIILMDVMMPEMDGPTTLLQLQENPLTDDIPVIFMTARAQARELDRFLLLGVVGVIPKPFDPMTLATSVRSYLPRAETLETLRASFLERLKRDLVSLAKLRDALDARTDIAGTLAGIKHIAHGLAGSGGVFGFSEISDASAALEEAAIAESDRPGSGRSIAAACDILMSCAGDEHVRHV